MIKYDLLINHIFCKQEFDRLCPVRKFAQDLKDYHE